MGMKPYPKTSPFTLDFQLSRFDNLTYDLCPIFLFVILVKIPAHTEYSLHASISKVDIMNQLVLWILYEVIAFDEFFQLRGGTEPFNLHVKSNLGFVFLIFALNEGISCKVVLPVTVT